MEPRDTSNATDRQFTFRVVAVACAVSCLLVVLDLWANRDSLDADVISYLDMADAYRHGDWRAALVGHWSPFYPWLLALMMFLVNPSPQWEFTAVHALNFSIFLLALGSFSVFMREFLRAIKAANERLPDWSWLVLGYSLFTWSTIRLTPPHLPVPDLIVSALLYLIFAVLFRIRRETVSWRESIFLGVLLALGYLAKAVMFPMAFVFTGVALILAGRPARNRYKILAAFSVFVLLSLPYIMVLSDANKRWMFSDAGRLNYAWEINQVKKWNHWQGEEGIHGTPLHATRKIYDNPPVYEFGTPFKVTYPPWYDPSYWYEGVKLTIDLRRQLSVVVRNTSALLFFLANSPGPAAPLRPAYYSINNSIDTTIGSLLTLCCVLVVANPGRRSAFRKLAEHWFVLIPIAAFLGMYALLFFEGRYIAGAVAILWLVLYRSVAIPYSEESKRSFTAVLVSAAMIAVITLATGTGRAVFDSARYFASGKTGAPFFQSGYMNWKVASYLGKAGLHAGDPVGTVGWSFSSYWARMARVHIVAEVPDEGATAFWLSDPATKAAVMQKFRDTGAKAVVAKAGYTNKLGQHVADLHGVPGQPSPLPTSGDSTLANWQHIGDTDYYVYVF